MRLRLILLVLSLLAFLSASAGGTLYYLSLREAAFKEVERQDLSRLEMIKKNISSLLSENIKPVKVLAGITSVRNALMNTNDEAIKQANATLDHFKEALAVEVCYLMDHQGKTIASSNRGDSDSFVGKNFNFRPYFKQAMGGKPATYLALGTTSGRRGSYYSHPVLKKDRQEPLGIVVIKASIELIEKELLTGSDEIVLVTDPKGIIFISNQKKWRYHSLWPLSPEDLSAIAGSMQFGKGPWDWTGLTVNTKGNVRHRSGAEFLVHQIDLDNYTGWQVIHLRNFRAVLRMVSDPMIRITGPIIMTLCLLIGISVFFLYRKASGEIIQRKIVENALRESEERYRTIYHNTPAMLHSIDPNGRLISVSDNWVEVMGCDRKEVIGRKLTDFLAPDSRRYAERVVFPQFFQTGFCKDIRYQFIKKNSDIMDVFLSAIGERDGDGNIIRSLAVSIDVTEHNRAEEALKTAKEQLSRYSKDLELQVKKRTEEISNILKYTPAVIYIKDESGRFALVNSRFEELFHTQNDRVRGKMDADVFPIKIAEQFRATDEEVLTEGRSFQLEDRIPQKDGVHTFLSVKFPIYDETDTVNGVCGILTDITPLKEAQNQLRRLSGSIMANQEKERSAMARELHDELGQVLTALRMDAVWIENRLKKIDTKATHRALTMCGLIDKTIQEVRGMAFRLRPGVLDDLGLVEALEWCTTDFEKRTGIACIFEHPHIPHVNDAVATAAYRITQEALTNVTRHSNASHVTVNIKAEEGVLKLIVGDDGIGFNSVALSESESLGVAVMRERANLVGGSLEVQSEPGRGARVYFKVPIRE